MKFEESTTLINVATSFTSETQEGARYQFMAKMAMQQQFTALQRVLKDLATNEMAHAEQFLNILKTKCGDKEVLKNLAVSPTYNYNGGDLLTMLRDTYEIEKHQQDVVYLNFSETANEEGFTDVAKLFDLIAKIEGDHALITKQLFEQMETNTLYKTEEESVWKCSECGHEITGTAPTVCPVCKSPVGAFLLKTDLARYYAR
ncbi:MAG: hypothetical protein LBH47_03200 [Christensenellaceae bacterium]|jgi:rubrerythrin|nr:hypothetical protein [Christensenellaceae bacterium]